MNPILVIPAYNEQESIVATVEGVRAAGYNYVVVNDGSTDATQRICRERGYTLLDLPMNLGIGGAVQAGHKYARAHGFDVVVQFDGDGQHDVGSVATLLDEVADGADLVVGSRFLSDSNTFHSTAARRAGIRWLQGVIRLRTGQTITDSTSGFRASGPRAIDAFCVSYPTDYPEPESVTTAILGGMDVREVGVVMHERQGGTSSISGTSALYYMIKVSLAILLGRRAGKGQGA